MAASDTPSPDDLLLLPEVAALTRYTVDTLRWLRHRGDGPPMFRLGRRLVARRGAVMEWIAQYERAAQGDHQPGRAV